MKYLGILSLVIMKPTKSTRREVIAGTIYDIRKKNDLID